MMVFALVQSGIMFNWSPKSDACGAACLQR